jgi:hypothetical protein
MTLVTKTQIIVSAQLIPATLGLSSTLALTKSVDFATGTGSGQADLLHFSTRILAASASEDLNFFDGSLKQPDGSPFAALSIKELYIRAADANTNEVVIGGASSNVWVGPFKDASDKIGVLPKAFQPFLHPSIGWTVSNTVKLLKIANGGAGTPVTYDLVLIGSSA